MRQYLITLVGHRRAAEETPGIGVIFGSVRDIAVSTNCEWMHRIAVSHASKKIVDRSLWVTGMPAPATFRFRSFGERLAKVQRIPFVVHRVVARPPFDFWVRSEGCGECFECWSLDDLSKRGCNFIRHRRPSSVITGYATFRGKARHFPSKITVGLRQRPVQPFSSIHSRRENCG